MIDEADAWPFPEIVAVQLPYGESNPPAGTVMVSRIADPDRVPESVPRPVTDVPVNVAVTVPDSVVSVCEICIVTSPGPEESVAVPFQEPARFSELDPDEGADGEDEDDPPPVQAAVETTARRPRPHTPARKAFITG